MLVQFYEYKILILKKTMQYFTIFYFALNTFTHILTWLENKEFFVLKIMLVLFF